MIRSIQIQIILDTHQFSKGCCMDHKKPKRYQLKDSTVEAVYYDGKNFDEIAHFTMGNAYHPFYAEKGIRCFTLNTQFGECRVYPGKYIVHIRGRLFMAVDPNIFKSRYEEIPEPEEKEADS